MKVCKKCNMTLSEILENGVVGCANCYIEFIEDLIKIILYLRICAKYLIKIIEKMQKNTKNFGKKPKIYQNYSIIDEQLDLLKRRLNLAIKEKRFEDAARFDDDIKRLEGGEDDE